MSYFSLPDAQGQHHSRWKSDDLPSFLSDFEEKRWRAEQLDRIRLFLDSAEKREAELKELLDWLSFTKESFDKFDHDRGSNDMASSEFIDAIESYLNKLMFDMDCGINRLNVLWKSFCQLNIRKSKKEETALHKGNVWHSWREPKVDTMAVSRIQELQPPTVEAILEDASLATKCASELSFLLEDIEKSMSGNKVLRIAFTFVQMGLQHINDAFQQRSTEVRQEKDRSSRKDSSNKMADLSVQLYMEREKITLLEDKVTNLTEQKQALLQNLHMQNIQEYSHTKDGKPPETAVVYQKILNLAKTEEAVTPQTSTIDVPKLTSKLRQKGPKQRNLTDTTRSDTSEEKAESLKEQIEKKSAHLLQDFRETVFKILESSMEFNDNKQLDIQQLTERAKPQNVVKLFQFLQVSMHDCFNDIMTHIRGKCRDDIMELPFQEMSLLESELWDSPEAHPSEMLKEMSVEIKKHSKSVQNVGVSLQALFSLQDKQGKGFEQKRRHTMAQLLDMFKNINDMEKQQACKMRLTLDSLWAMHRRIQEKEKPANIHLPSVPPIPKKPAVKEMPDNKTPEVFQEGMKEHVVVKEHTMVETPEAIKEQDQKKLKPILELCFDSQPQRLSPVRDGRMSVSPSDHMDRYTAEMAEETQVLLQSRLMGTIYVINVASQRVNVQLLEQALLRRAISPRLYRLVRDIIMQTLASVEIRLSCIMQRFLRHARLRQVYKILNARLLEARTMNDGHSIRKCYIYLQKLEKLQRKVSDSGCTKQASIDHIRKTSIAHMLYLFKQLKLDYGINMAAPYCSSVCLPYPILTVVPKKLQWSLSPSHCQCRHYSNSQTPVQSSPLSPLLPFLPPYEHHQPTRESERTGGSDEDRLKRLWQIKRTNNSMWLASKRCAVPPLPFPILPRLLEMDVNEGRRKARRTLQDRQNGVLGQILKSRGDN